MNTEQTRTLHGPPPSDTLPSAAPELVGLADYDIRRKLGQGGMGAVYLARNLLADRDEALKVITPEHLARPDAEARFRREIQAMIALGHHPNVATAYTAFRHGGALVLAMEYVAGRDLSAEVKARVEPLPIPHACSYIAQAAKGLQHAHGKGLTHRDVKPSNLMLTKVGGKLIVKVLDFGLAKVAAAPPGVAGGTRTGAIMGTPDYIAPEQARDTASADIRADVYSLGCSLYFLLARTPPFPGGTEMDKMIRHLQDDPRPIAELRPDVPADLAAVLAKMMAKDPAARFQTPGEAMKALAPFTRPAAATKPVAALPVSPSAGSTDHPSATVPELPARTVSLAFPDVVSAMTTAALPSRPKPTRPRRGWLAAVAVGLALAAVGGAWAGGVFRVQTKYGTLIVENVPDGADVAVDGESVTVTRDGKTVTLTAVKEGKHTLRVTAGGTELYARDDVTVTVGGQPVRVRVEGKGPREIPATNEPELVIEVVKARPTAGKPREKEFMPLFNGRNLTGWQVDGGTPDQWTILDGAITGKSAEFRTRTCLLTTRDYTDYVLRFKYHLHVDGNAAVLIRPAFGDKLPLNNNLLPDHPMIKLGGPAKFDPIGTSHWVCDGYTNARPQVILQPRPDVWHQAELTLRGDSCQLTVDGESAAVVKLNLDARSYQGIIPGLKRSRGKVGFQVHEGAVEFRNISIIENP